MLEGSLISYQLKSCLFKCNEFLFTDTQLIHLVTLCVLIGDFNPFILEVIHEQALICFLVLLTHLSPYHSFFLAVKRQTQIECSDSFLAIFGLPILDF